MSDLQAPAEADWLLLDDGGTLVGWQTGGDAPAAGAGTQVVDGPRRKAQLAVPESPALLPLVLPAPGLPAPVQPPPGVVEVDLEAEKSRAMQEIDRQAEQVRNRFITPGAGQAMEYLATEEEARELRALPAEAEIEPADFPLVAAEMAVRGGTMADAATRVLLAAAAWRQVGAQIKQLRLAGKDAVAAAETLEEVWEAASIEWPT